MPTPSVLPAPRSLSEAAKDLTKQQFAIARQLAGEELGMAPGVIPISVLISLVQVVASNYHALRLEAQTPPEVAAEAK